MAIPRGMLKVPIQLYHVTITVDTLGQASTSYALYTTSRCHVESSHRHDATVNASPSEIDDIVVKVAWVPGVLLGDRATIVDDAGNISYEVSGVEDDRMRRQTLVLTLTREADPVH